MWCLNKCNPSSPTIGYAGCESGLPGGWSEQGDQVSEEAEEADEMEGR